MTSIKTLEISDLNEASEHSCMFFSKYLAVWISV